MPELTIAEILDLDWTSNEGEGKIFLERCILPEADGTGEHFLTNYKRFLVSRNGCFDNHQNNEEDCIAKLEQDSRNFRLTVEKNKILEVVEYLAVNNVIATKICFGFDKPIIEGGKMQLSVSGTFWKEATSLTGITERLFAPGGVVPRFHNFDMGKEISGDTFTAFHEILVTEVVKPNELTTEGKNAIFGYVMSTRTLLSMLKKDEHFGDCSTIDFDFGMSRFRIGEEVGKLLMVKIHSSEKPKPVYWLYDTEKIHNDPFTCPPREPCR